MIKYIDINCDMGESYGNFRLGHDLALMPFLSSCNIACGFHGGDPSTLLHTLEEAGKQGLRIGAHPSLPDLRGFGRTEMRLPLSQLKADIMYQISALSGMAGALGLSLSYVKAHGFLYHWIHEEEGPAETFLEALHTLDPKLSVMGRPESLLQKLAKHKGMAYIREGFLDRRYREDGSLLPRSEPSALLDKQEVLAQLRQILEKGEVLTREGSPLALEVDSLCLHGDHPQALLLAEAVYQQLSEWQVGLQNFPAKR